jgi:hypothetical protein
MGAGLRPSPKGVETPPDPEATTEARARVIACVNGQKSAEAVVAAEGSTRAGRDEGPNMDTRRSRGQLVRGVEPDRVSHSRRWVTPPALILR